MGGYWQCKTYARLVATEEITRQQNLQAHEAQWYVGCMFCCLENLKYLPLEITLTKVCALILLNMIFLQPSSTSSGHMSMDVDQ